MKIRSWARRASVVSGMMLALGWVAAASAAPAARVVVSHARYHLSYRHAGIEIQDISATGPKAAWAIGYGINAVANPAAGVVLRYDGKRWAAVRYPGEKTFLPESITALSPADVWMLGNYAGSGAVLHYLDGAWTSLPLPADSAVGGWLVLSDTDIWVAAGPGQIPGCDSRELGPGCSAAAHWNGTKWQYYPVAVSTLTSLAGTSATDIWAAGFDGVNQARGPAPMQPFVFRWTGSGFRRVTLAARQTDYVPYLTVVSPRNVWLGGTTPVRTPGTCVAHWNGRRWSAFSTAPTGYLALCDNLVPDGHRGVWLAPAVHWTGSEFVVFGPPPAVRTGGLTQGVAPVPGSRVDWIYGYRQNRDHGVYQITGYIYSRG
jgi:hypothetical protein